MMETVSPARTGVVLHLLSTAPRSDGEQRRFARKQPATGEPSVSETKAGAFNTGLCREYDRLRKAAPRRSARNKRYFVGHDGRPQAKYPGRPSEKHLAIALWRLEAQWPRAGGGRMRLLDYQVPLKASSLDTGLGESISLAQRIRDVWWSSS